MTTPNPERLCRYHYDPLDRLASCLPLGQADTSCFYRLNRLTTEIQGQIGTSWLQTQDRLLAQCQLEAGTSKGVLIATDAAGSVSHTLGADQPHAFGYMPYGTRVPAQAPLHLPGFNGQRRDPVTGHYLLGNGYRAFNPVLMRFNSPDSLSPFGEGGLNAYAYCVGDPVNRVDPSGHVPGFLKAIWRYVRPVKKPIAATNIKKVADGIWAFERLSPNNKTIGFLLHGTTTPPDGFQPMHLAMSGGDALTAQALKNRAINAGIDFQYFDSSELLGCFLGTGGEKSYAKAFSDLTEIPSRSYDGLVSTNLSPTDIENLIAEQSRYIRKLPNGNHEYPKGIFAYKRDPLTIFSRNKKFNYRPVTFKKLHIQIDSFKFRNQQQ